MALHKYFKVDTSDVQTNLPWDKKYAPKTMEDVACNAAVAASIKNWYLTNKTKTNNLAVVIGPNGCGKTTIVELALKSAQAHVIHKDVHATRAKHLIEELTTLFALNGEGCCIVLDNVDMNCKSVVEFIKDTFLSAKKKDKVSHCSLVVISNNLFNTVQSLLSCEHVFYCTVVPPVTMYKVLKDIKKQVKGFCVSEAGIKEIIKKSVGDMSYAIQQTQFANARKDSFQVIKRVEHKTVFDACDTLFHNPHVGINQGTYLISIDPHVVSSLLFENYWSKKPSLDDIAKLSNELSMTEIMLTKKNQTIEESATCMLYSLKSTFSKYPTHVKDMKYPSVFSKTHLLKTYQNLQHQIMSKTSTCTGHLSEVKNLAEMVTKHINKCEWERLADISHAYNLSDKDLLNMVKISTFSKTTLKQSQKKAIAEHAKK